MKRAITLWFFLIMGIFVPKDLFGEDEFKKRYRLEANLSYEYLSPNEVYGSRKTLNIGFYDKPRKDLTSFLQLGSFSRKEGEALLGVMGAYKDWGDSLYTYSALSIGTKSDYLPQIRIDHDFNIKLGSLKNIVWTAGISYLKHFDVHKDLILSTGITFYYHNWIWSYRLFRNESDPDNVISYSQLISVGYGREGWQWTFFDFSYGKQAYLATYLASPQEVRQDSLNLSLKHRRWIGKDYGMFGDISYFKLKDGYDKYGFSFGIFKEF